MIALPVILDSSIDVQPGRRLHHRHGEHTGPPWWPGHRHHGLRVRKSAWSARALGLPTGLL